MVEVYLNKDVGVLLICCIATKCCINAELNPCKCAPIPALSSPKLLFAAVRGGGPVGEVLGSWGDVFVRSSWWSLVAVL